MDERTERTPGIRSTRKLRKSAKALRSAATMRSTKSASPVTDQQSRISGRAVTACSKPCTSSSAWRSSDTLENAITVRSEEHTSELQSLMRISYAVFCLQKKKIHTNINRHHTNTSHKQ